MKDDEKLRRSSEGSLLPVKIFYVGICMVPLEI
jgi:hypothetical protein